MRKSEALARQLLLGALAQGRQVHAYLLTGSAEAALERLAAEFAAAALAVADVEAHPDYRVVRPQGAAIKIDQIRELQRDVALRPLNGRQKVYVVAGADKCTEEAANAMLKLLEEPPAYAVILLTSTRPSALLDTVRSRCQEVPVRLAPPELAEQLAAEGIAEGLATTVAFLAAGDEARARELATSPEAAALRDKVSQLALAVAAGGPLAAFRAAAELEGYRKEGADLQLALTILAGIYRDALLLAAGVPGLGLLPDQAEVARMLAVRGGGWLLQAVSAIEAAKDQIQRRANLRLCLDVLCLGLAGEGSLS